jgi:hypothetical protein
MAGSATSKRSVSTGLAPLRADAAKSPTAQKNSVRSRGNSRIDRGMIQDGKLREFARGHAIPVRTDYTAGEVRRFAQQRKTLRRRTAVSDCGRARGGLAGRGGEDWWHESSDAAGLGDPVQRWAIPSRRANQGRGCGAAEIQRTTKNAPRWTDMNLAAEYESEATMLRCRLGKLRDLWQARAAYPCSSLSP